jgi:hypothetical protein
LLTPEKQLGFEVKQVPISEASPVIPVPDPDPVAVTVIFEVTVAPCTMDTQLVPAGVPDGHVESGDMVSAVEVGVNVPTAAGQPFTRFVTLTEPRPVARSYPEVALKPRPPFAKGLSSSVTRTPTAVELAFVLLQSLLPPAHG